LLNSEPLISAVPISEREANTGLNMMKTFVEVQECVSGNPLIETPDSKLFSTEERAEQRGGVDPLAPFDKTQMPFVIRFDLEADCR